NAILRGQYVEGPANGGFPIGRGGSRIYKTGTGTWRLENENVYQNLTRVAEGTLVVAHPKALGYAAVERIGTSWPRDGKAHVYSGATMGFGGNVNYGGLTQMGTWALLNDGRWYDTGLVMDPNNPGQPMYFYQVIQIAGAGAA